jgi:hypothetical protein
MDERRMCACHVNACVGVCKSHCVFTRTTTLHGRTSTRGTLVRVHKTNTGRKRGYMSGATPLFSALFLLLARHITERLFQVRVQDRHAALLLALKRQLLQVLFAFNGHFDRTRHVRDEIGN